jgi:hypothetical protein
MRQLIFIAALCLHSGLAIGDFEIKDPALLSEEEAITPENGQAGDYAVEGAGVKSCDTYLADRKKNSSMHYINLNWAKGFISGVNYIHAESRGNTQLGAGLDQKALALWLDSYCQGQPTATLSDASAALVDQLIN